MTWDDLIRSSLRLINQLTPGRTPGQSEVTDATLVLNSLLDSLNADRLNIFTIASAAYNLTAGQQSYTIGAGGVFNTTRPQRIENANLILPGAGNLRQPLKLLNDSQFASIKLQSVQSTIPQYLYNDGNFPLSTLYLYPIPSGTLQLELWTWQLLTAVTSTAAAVSLPSGAADMIRYQLAVRLAAEWGKPLRPEVAELARVSLANYQRANLPMPTMACDGGVLSGNRGGSFNWLTGEIGR